MLLGLVVAALSIDRQAYWLDELGTWRIALPSDFSAWFASFLEIENSDGQLPLYHAIAFAWSKLFGLEELALRGLNAGFLILLLWAILATPIFEQRQRTLWALLLLSNCFVWAYLNEARPYVALTLGTTLLTLALAEAAKSAPTAVATDATRLAVYLLGGGLVSIGASPVSAPFVVAIVAACLLLVGAPMVRGVLRSATKHWFATCIWLVVSLAVTALVCWSLLKGATPELRNTTTASSIAFGLVEVGGGAGLLPGRSALRTEGMQSILSWQWIALAVLAASTLAGLLFSLRGPDATFERALVCVLIVSAAGVWLLAVKIGFRVLGRHMAFLVPPLMLLIATGVLRAPKRAGVMIGATTLTLMIASSLIFRLSQDHLKDDSRAPSAIAQRLAAKGAVTWWIGADTVPAYFGLSTSSFAEARRTPRPGGLIVRAAAGEEWRDRERQALPPPSAIVVERPEVNDADGFFASAASSAGLPHKRDLRGYTVYYED